MNDETEAIKREIAASRARLTASVEALAYRANAPARAKEAVDTKLGTIKKTLLRAVGRGRRNVFAAAAQARAASQDAIVRVQSTAKSARSASADAVDNARMATADTADQTRSATADAIVQARAATADAAARARSAAASAVDQARVVAENVRLTTVAVFDRARSATTEAVDHVSPAPVTVIGARVVNAAASVREKLGEPLRQVVDLLPDSLPSKGPSEIMQAFLARNPLGFALVSIAAGLVIGFVIPVSDIERDTVGPMGEHLIDDATAAANDVIDRGKALVATIVPQ